MPENELYNGWVERKLRYTGIPLASLVDEIAAAAVKAGWVVP